MQHTQTTTAKKSNTEIKVLAINTLYEYAEKFYNYEKEYLSKFIGVNVFKVDGSLKAKYDHEKLAFKGQLSDGTYFDAHYWLSYRHGYLDICVKICINGGSYDVQPTTAFCQYENTTITLFKTQDDKLTETNTDISYLKERFNLQDLKAIATEIKEAEKQYEETAKKMPYIFNDVFYIGRVVSR
jgi:hypothetical protein